MPLEDVIAAALPEILHAFESALRSVDSPLLKNDVSRAQVLAHSRGIVTKTANEIGGVPGGGTNDVLPREIGATRAVTGVHPNESLRAARMLFGTVMGHLAGPLRHQLTAEDLATAALTLHGVISDNLIEAADAYIGVLLNRVHQMQIEERKRVSRDLHDRIGNEISIAHRNLELFEIYRVEQPERAIGRLDAARRALSESMSSVRQAISTLRLVEPVESLEKALRGYLEESAPAEMVARIEVNGDEAWASDETIEQVFLIVREALRNTIAHAAAGQVLVRIDIAPGELRAVIADDGRGFEPGDGDGTGLMSMRERALLLDGSVTLVSTPGRGTRVELWLPLGGPES